MKHARLDYERIQDPWGKIPESEPVFLLRAQDCTAAEVVRYWASLQPSGELKEAAYRQAEKMDAWPRKKIANITKRQIGGKA